MNGYLVSVIIPTFNRAFSLHKCINSVLNQSHENLEVIIVDDGSTDNSYEVIRQYLKNSRVRYIKHETNKGAQAARNTGIKSAAGNYIAFLDSDDEWLPKKIEIQLDKARESKRLCVIHSDTLVAHEGTDETKRLNVPQLDGCVHKELLRGPGPLLQCILAPRSCFGRIGYLDENVPSWQEWDTSIALSKHYEFIYCDVPLTIYSLHAHDTISKDKKRTADGWRYIVNKYKSDIITQLGLNALAMHYLTLYVLYEKADEKRTALIFLIKSCFASPSQDNVSILLNLFLGKKMASTAARVYRLCRRKA